MRHRSILPRFLPDRLPRFLPKCLAAGTVTLAMLTGLSTAPAFAATGPTALAPPVSGSHRPAEPAPMGAVVGGTDAAASQHGKLTAAQLRRNVRRRGRRTRRPRRTRRTRRGPLPRSPAARPTSVP